MTERGCWPLVLVLALVVGAARADWPGFEAPQGRTLPEPVVFALPPRVPSYAVATLPSASPAGQLVYVSDESGGAVLAFSDGADWRRVTDRAVVS